MKLFRMKNKQSKTRTFGRETLRSPRIPVIHSLRHFSNLRNPSLYAFARHVRSEPRRARRKIGSGTCPAKFARAFLRVCEKGPGGDFQRRETPRVARSQGLAERKRHARLIFSMRSAGRSTSISSGRGARNFTGARSASEQRREGNV